MEIGAFFQCYKNRKATWHALKAFRDAYPRSTVIMMNDNGDDFSDIAAEFNAKYFHEFESCPPSFDRTDKTKQSLCIARWQKYLPLIEEEYFMVLEDDVLVKKAYEEPFLGTINGNTINYIKEHVWDNIPFTNVRGKLLYSGHGGSVYHKERFLHAISNKEVVQYLFDNWKEIGLCPVRIDFDILCSILVILDGGTIHKLNTHKDMSTNRTTVAHVLHQYKVYY
jgi:hypothetical protein